MMPVLRPAVFLDRDGVLNRSIVRGGKPYPPRSLSEVEVLPGVAEALGRLREAGFLLIVVTNQPDVARGTQRREVVEAINGILRELLPLDDVLTCYEDGDSPRRKPNPGMILEAAAVYGIELNESFLIGDRWKDVEAGYRAGCQTVLLDYEYGEAKPPTIAADFITCEIGDAVNWILATRTSGGRKAG
jgi:D-glycero-D-manno-heptose 1,7-bisphosphate phosphatase